MTTRSSPRPDVAKIPDIPADVCAACAALGWEVIRRQHLAGEIAYLVVTDTGVVEPYSRQAILQQAAIFQEVV